MRRDALKANTIEKIAGRNILLFQGKWMYTLQPLCTLDEYVKAVSDKTADNDPVVVFGNFAYKYIIGRTRTICRRRFGL